MGLVVRNEPMGHFVGALRGQSVSDKRMEIVGFVNNADTRGGPAFSTS